MATFSNEAWDAGRAAKGKTAGEYCAICLIDANPKGAEKIKAKCNLPLQYTSGGPYVRMAIRNAMGRIFQVTGAPADVKRKAARRLITLARQGGIAVGSASLYRLAGMKQPR